MAFELLERHWTLTSCDYTPTFFSPYLLIFYFAHYAIGLIVFVLGVVRREMYLLVFSLGMSANLGLNLLLRWAFMVPIRRAECGSGALFCIARNSTYNACGTGPYPVVPPAGATCGGGALPDCDPCVPCGMPALEPQLTAFTVASIGVFAFQWSAPMLRYSQFVWLLLFYSTVMYAHIFFGFNTAADIFVGSAIGVAAALLWQMAVYELLYPKFDTILHWWPFAYFGYKNTYCADDDDDNALAAKEQ
jgi:hypothetical protein